LSTAGKAIFWPCPKSALAQVIQTAPFADAAASFGILELLFDPPANHLGSARYD